MIVKQVQKIAFAICFWGIVWAANGQATSGASGLLNIPSAKMKQDGLFMAGANFLPENITPERFPYNTGNYYFNLTFLPFLEVYYRCTLFQSAHNNGKYTEQDRSFGGRLRVLKERKFLPALAVGANDIYSQISGNSNQCFGALYFVGTKCIDWSENNIEITAGYGFDTFKKKQLEGIFCGISYTPACFRQLRLMADYDTHSVNLGGSVLLFNHLYINAFLNNFENFVAGAAVLIYLY